MLEVSSCYISRDRETPYWWTTVSSYKDWGIELQSQREILQHFAHVPLTETRGGQAPNLHLGSNTQFAAMQDFGFEWDGSVSPRVLSSFLDNYGKNPLVFLVDHSPFYK